MQQFRNGQWVKFRGHFDGAHVARGGKVVGIFQKGGTTALGDLAQSDHIVVVTPKGENLMTNIDGILVAVKVGINQPGLEPILDRQEIPPERLIHTPKEWQPSP
jgi:hypothetical protein